MLQRQALFVMNRGDSVFLTGPAGSGKTFVLNQFIDRLKKAKKNVAITASTGIAATHIGGTTIHSWSGLGIRDSLTEQDKTWLAGNDRLKKRYNQTDVLIIDEVSMLHGKRLDMVSEACKLLRGSPEPFGGLQVILTGDLFQLPPVNRQGGADDFVHTSDAWAELNPKICYLTEQHRQQNDHLLELLSAMREDRLEDYHQDTLQERIGVIPPDADTLTRLYAHNVDVESINDRHLKALESEVYRFEMDSSGRGKYVDQLKKGVLTPEVLELKVGAEVMFVANNFAQGFVNGSRGRVIDFNDGLPVVELKNGGRTVVVEPHSWTLAEDGRERAKITQLPLRLAWAITIHKSQGMSLDGAIIDLGRSFTYGMGYVALSRVRSLDGLYLAGINRMALKLHPGVYEFDARIRSDSSQLAQEIGDVAELTEQEPEQSAAANVELFERLRQWRGEEARRRSVAAYVIAHNKTLEELAARVPATERELLACRGIGQKFVDSYGQAIFEIVKAFAGEPVISEPSEPVESTDSKQKRDQVTAEYPRAFKKWTPEEDAKLTEFINQDVLLTDICAELERQPNGVWARAVKLLRER